MNDKHKENVREELEKRGFSLELETYMMLKKHGWFSALQSFFTDVPVSMEERSMLEAIRDLWKQPTKPIYRTIDVTGLKFISSELDEVSSVLVSLIVECKWRAKENWASERIWRVVELNPRGSTIDITYNRGSKKKHRILGEETVCDWKGHSGRTPRAANHTLGFSTTKYLPKHVRTLVQPQ